MEFLPGNGHAGARELGETMSKRPRRNHTPAFKAKVGIGRSEGEEDARRAGAAVRPPPQSDHSTKIRQLTGPFSPEESRILRAAWLENNVPEGIAVFKLPRPHQRPMRTSNPIERSIQQELKRRTRKIRVFPNEASLSVSSPPFSSKSTRDGPHHRNPMSTSTTPMPINVHRGKSRRQVA